MVAKLNDKVIGDSHRGLSFTVRKSDIENGQPNDPCNCAAARALKRSADAREVYVYRNVTYLVPKSGNPVRYKTPPDLRLETIVYDRKGAFFPGDYELQPMPIHGTKKKKAAGAGNGNRGRKAGGEYRVVPNVRPTAAYKLNK